MKTRTRRIMSAVVAATASMSLLLPAAVSAQSFNPANGCKTEVQIKKAASPVVHDGVISPGEYEEIPFSRVLEDGSPTADCDITFGYQANTGFEKALEVFPDVHFYVSWDEQNGLNFAVSGKTKETPKNENDDWPMDKVTSDDHGTYPSDEFIFQLGAMFRVCENAGTADAPDFVSIINRGFTRTTTTNKLLYGWYWEHGYDDYLLSHQQTPEQDYNCKIDVNTHECVFEISYPFAAALKSDSYSGTIPNEGATVYFDMSFVGGGQGVGSENADSYAISMGDGGYLADSQIPDPKPATGTFTSAVVGGGSTGGETGGNTGDTPGGNTGDTPGGETGGNTGTTTNPGGDTGNGGNGGTTTPGGDTGNGGNGGTTTTPGGDTGNGGNGGTTTNPGNTGNGGNGGTTTNPGNTGNGGNGGTTPTPGNTGNGGTNTNRNPQTGDAMAILAVVSALSAGGAMIFKKRR